MSQLTIDLALDNYRSTLSQSYNWGAGSIYVNTVPNVTFPIGKKVLLTINPEKSTMQVVELDGWDSVAKTLNCTWATVKRGEWVNYSATEHSIWDVVKISIPYDAWDDIKTAIDSKTNTNSADTATGKFADATARDAYFTAPVNWNTAYLTSLWAWTDYIGGAWSTRATGSVVNADTTTAGKVEISTQAENTAGTATGWTGASLSATPAGIATVIQSGSRLYAWVSATGNDTYVVTMTPALAAYTTWMQIRFKTDVANTGPCTININSLGAKSIKLIDWSDPMDWDIPATSVINLVYDWTNMVYDNTLVRATTAQANTGTDTKAVLTSNLLVYAWSAPIAWTTVTVASLTTERFQTGTTYTQKYIWTVLRTWTYTVSFWLSRQNGGSGGTAYGRIYKNGVAFGTEQSTTNAYSSFVTKTENLAFTAWDTISLWLKAGVPASDIAYANNFLVTCSQPQFTIV